MTGGYGYLLASNEPQSCWQAWLDADNDMLELAEYAGKAQGIYRAATFKGGRIDLCLFVEPMTYNTDWEAVKALFAARTITDAQRRSLLSGRRVDGASDAGPVVCACFGVGRNAICAAIASGIVRSHDEIGARLKAGTNCGSCIPELKRLLAETASVNTATSLPQREIADVAG